jgi:uncharacterized protein
MATYRSPGVYIEEIPTLPPSIAEVESAVPAFIGYTQKAMNLVADDLLNVPTPIDSLAEYEQYFGDDTGIFEDAGNIKIDVDEQQDSGGNTTGYSVVIDITTTALRPYILHNAMQLYFANGGTRCYIVSVGYYTDKISLTTATKRGLQDGLGTIGMIDGPTILLSPEAISLNQGDFNAFNQAMLNQASTLKDRFAIIDTLESTTPKSPGSITTDVGTAIDGVANGTSQVGLQYGAVYYPFLQTIYNLAFDFPNLTIDKYTTNGAASDPKGLTGKAMSTLPYSLYSVISAQYQKYNVILPPSAAIAGVYCGVDANRGVWKAPANVALTDVNKATVTVARVDQDSLNVNDTTGKSVNAILNSPGFGIVVMGARTLDGNDNEWRYINVRRFFIMVEQSVKNSTGLFVFEPNTSITWVKVQAMIENYLFQKWRDGALAGAKPEQAYYVNVGLGSTMTAQDILEGRLIVQIGMAVARPAEFIIMEFIQMLQSS